MRNAPAAGDDMEPVDRGYTVFGQAGLMKGTGDFKIGNAIQLFQITQQSQLRDIFSDFVL